APPAAAQKISKIRCSAAANARRRDDSRADRPRSANRSLLPEKGSVTPELNLGLGMTATTRAGAWHRYPATAQAILEPAASLRALLFRKQFAWQALQIRGR